MCIRDRSLETLTELSLLDGDLAQFLIDRYEFLRRVESGIRLMNTTARHDLPSDSKQLQRLAFLLNEPSGTSLADEVRQTQEKVRERVAKLFEH